MKNDAVLVATLGVVVSAQIFGSDRKILVFQQDGRWVVLTSSSQL
jgi:hypothetical protein